MDLVLWDYFRALKKEVGELKKEIEEIKTHMKYIPHGKWTNGDCRCPICGEDKFKGLDADIWSDWKPNYCPNCGAKMDGEK